MEIQLKEQTILTRDNLITTLTNLEQKIVDLSIIIEAKLESNDEQQDQLFNFKSKNIQLAINVIFRANCIASSIAFTLFILSIFTLLEVVTMTFHQLQIIAFFLLSLTIIWVIVLILVTVEQISCLINRTARIKIMSYLYFSLVMLFALIYTEIEVGSPNSFNGISIVNYTGCLRTIQQYFDFIYFSSVCQSSVGFGDINPRVALSRFFVFPQTLISVAYLSILFSNWIS
ncbi:Ion channel domain-containing protein [Spironucleus salmonicida]|uniref:Ion channel and transmembrane domain-containing protein n=1 Tax=Spironucleus salmonicida TaxID=348837 RepID=V6LGB5_9EUKA|nr:Ion channel domain-containing protein [Spironucleus salmonicida]|eukprot:EST42711.1 Ion channel and transmembrane domain-containing protein [Spironucleus salmonicida]